VKIPKGGFNLVLKKEKEGKTKVENKSYYANISRNLDMKNI
jgi:hypothetical protein